MKLLVSDFDVTFFPNNFEENVLAVKRWVAAGNHFVFATGRNYNLLQKDLKNITVPYQFLICNDGALIMDANKQELYRKNISREVANNLMTFLKQREINGLLIDDGYNYHDNLVSNNNAIFFSIVKNFNYENIFNDVLNNFVNITGYMTKKQVLFYDASVDKKTAIKWLLNKNNYEKLYVIGDGINDYEMIKGFNGYYVGENELIKTVAKKKVSSVANLIDKIMAN